MYRRSKQRDRIKEALMATTEHPSAETVYLSIKSSMPSISLATVYRNLNLLVETGEITRISGAIGSERYDGNTKPHYHFFCEKCDAIIDLPSWNEDATLMDYMRENFKGEIYSHITNFYGLCDKCLNKE